MFGTSVLLLLLFSACSCQRNRSITYLNAAVDPISEVNYNPSMCNDCLKRQKALDCSDLHLMGHNTSGVYKIWPMSRKTNGQYLTVYCDMETNGGGWTVIQRRGDYQRESDYFFREWESYKEGFGYVDEDFWIGNDNIFALTNQRLYSVRFDLEDYYNNKNFALYDNFWIDDENSKYTIHISDYSGNAGNYMDFHDNQRFSTKDEDNDKRSSQHCAQDYKGGWWYKDCYQVNLNGIYQRDATFSTEGILWSREGNTLKWTEIKIRPKNFRISHVPEEDSPVN